MVNQLGYNHYEYSVSIIKSINPLPKECAMSDALYKIALKELEASTEDIRPSDILVFSEPLASALNFVIRLGRFSLTEFAEKLEFTRDETKKIADILVERKLFEVTKFSTAEETFYQSRLSAMTRPMKRPPLDIWKKLD
jgi:hypothetical protein